jgi:hypothetical protein
MPASEYQEPKNIKYTHPFKNSITEQILWIGRFAFSAS